MNLNKVRKIDNKVPVVNALISVADKTGLEAFVSGLGDLCPGIRIYSTGGTYGAIEKILTPGGRAGCLHQVSSYTGQPEMQGGLVKTLDYKIYLGLLSETYNQHHQADLKRIEARTFDLVVVNLYPFREALAAGGETSGKAAGDALLEEGRTHIDIGGPCMLRAGAKNFLRVAAVCDPGDYSALLGELKKTGGRTELATRFRLAKKVFRHTAEYDAAIADYFGGLSDDTPSACYETM
jgi:phosphoribosylaminoimidazolecarboxamide formyltransferase/IMP cyclohydrolase